MRMLLPLILALCFAISATGQTHLKSAQWNENYKRWQTLSADRKAELKRRFETFRKMNEQERKQFQERAERIRKLTPDQRQRLKQKWEFYRNLTERQKQAFRKFTHRLRMMPSERRLKMRRRLELLRGMEPERRERYLDRNRNWGRLSEQQKDAIRRFLFNDKNKRPL